MGHAIALVSNEMESIHFLDNAKYIRFFFLFIGMRLGKAQTRVGLIKMLQKFRFELDDRHKNAELKFDPKNFLISPLDEILLRIFRR